MLHGIVSKTLEFQSSQFFMNWGFQPRQKGQLILKPRFTQSTKLTGKLRRPSIDCNVRVIDDEFLKFAFIVTVH